MANLKVSEQAYPSTRYTEVAAPSTPAAGEVIVYAKSDGLVYAKDDAGTETALSNAASGSVATDAIWDAAGDLAVGSGSNTAAKLAIGATNGMALRRVSGAVAWDLPPGHEFDYVQITSPVSPTATTEATANTIVTANAVTYDGSTVIVLEFFAPGLERSTTGSLFLYLYDGSSSIGRIGLFTNSAAATARVPCHVRYRFTPSAAAHTYSIRGVIAGSGTATVTAGAGGSTGAEYPAFIRQTKV